MRKVLTPEYHRTIRSASGRKLKIHVSDLYINIEDAYQTRYRLNASVNEEEQTVRFDISTKSPFFHPGIRTTHGRHPDFFAGAFVHVAFDYFEAQGIRIGAARAYWLQDSDNYRDFMRNIRRGIGLAESANRTWTGLRFNEHGYTVFEDNDVATNAIGGRPLFIMALFRQH